jgi:DNA-binding transcriptional ArsR family regulator
VPTPPPPSAAPDPVDFVEAATTFAMLATPTRVRILWLLAHGERDVTSLAEATGATVPTVSQHLAKLRLAGLVIVRPDGRHQIYRVEDPHIIALVNQAVEHHQDLRRRNV